ncbi:MAG: hypothetical protein M1562_01655 [Candidatus Marsarchaeota archaeon]|jgi:hypothetical protein|nr:hypothetical protein [Candidatus Marsarchaeota archaeon]
MRLNRILVNSLLVFGLLSILAFISNGQNATYGIGQWTGFTPYPINISSSVCVNNSTYIYCTTGETEVSNGIIYTNSSYYINISKGNGAQWIGTTRYPVPFSVQPSCITNSSYIYCIGGYKGQNAYYAKLSDSGIGEWIPTTQYPISNITSTSCSGIGNQIICVGGDSEGATNSTYTADISSSGISGWVAASPYPINTTGEECESYSGYDYCTGGLTNQSFYGYLSGDGNVTWNASANYSGYNLGISCTTYLGMEYCTGGLGSSLQNPSSIGLNNLTYYGYLDNAGVIGWYPSNYTYPHPILYTSCITYSGSIYCIGGMSGQSSPTPLKSVYYAPIYYSSGIPPATTTTTTSSTTTIIYITVPGYNITYNTTTRPTTSTIPVVQPNTTSTQNSIFTSNSTISPSNSTSTILSSGSGQYNQSSNSTNSTARTPSKKGNGTLLLIIIIIVIVAAIIIVWLFIRSRKG